MQNPGDKRSPRPGGNNDRDQARRTALGGLLAAMALLFIFLASVAPTADLSLMTLASFCVAIAVIENGTSGALLLYITVSLLSAVWPGIAFSWPFVAFFGIFPLIKAFAEKRWPRFPAAIFKLTISAVLILIGIQLFAIALLQDYAIRFGAWILPLLLSIGLVVVLVYDYALTLLITGYVNRRPKR